MQANKVVIISDSCFSGALLRGGGEQPPKIADADRERALLTLAQRRTRILISSGNNEPVEDRGGKGHSIFAQALLTGLEDMQHDPSRRASSMTAICCRWWSAMPIRSRNTGRSSARATKAAISSSCARRISKLVSRGTNLSANTDICRRTCETALRKRLAATGTVAMAGRDALTKNQLLVLEKLEAASGPLSAYTLLDQLREHGFRAPLQVYRALDTLLKSGFVHRLESLNAFVACAEPHDHSHGHSMTAFAICDKCGQVTEFSDEPVGERLDQWVGSTGFVAKKAVIEFRGTCGKCAAIAA